MMQEQGSDIFVQKMAAISNSVSRKKIQSRSFKEGKSRQYPLLNLYILVFAILQIFGEMTDIFLLRLLKPVPMVLMIFYISGKNSNRDHLVPTLIRAGLILSLIGDVLLMINEMSAFMIGTLFFFIAHILYCIAFTIGTPVRIASFGNKLGRGIIYLVLVFLCFVNIYEMWNLMPNRTLFSSYGMILCLMMILAVKRYQITTPYSYGFIISGALLFGLSDNLLGLLKFNGIKSDIGRGFVMLFYYSAQYLLMHGAMHHSNLQNEINKFLKINGGSTVPTLSSSKAGTKYSSRHWDHGAGEEMLIEKNRIQ